MGIDNWIGWLQARIPELKKSHNAFWVKQALEGYSLEAEKKALNTSNVVGRSEQYACECKVCGKPFDNKDDLYEHYDYEHN